MHRHDAIVVGGGPAGLSAALYLARYCRDTLVIDDGRSRALAIPRSHNVPGFAAGIAGPDLIDQMRAHAGRYGARLTKAHIVAAARDGDDFVLAADNGGEFRGRTLVLATGLATDPMDLAPDVLRAAITAGTLRYCPICDGYEHRGKRIAVIGALADAAGEALFLRTFSNDVTLVSIGDGPVPAAEAAALLERGVALVHGSLLALEPGTQGIGVRIGDDAPLWFDVLYPVEVTQPRSALARDLGVGLGEKGKLPADAMFGAGVDGLFGAGDIVEGLDQISVAMGHGAIAATRAHNWLRERDGQAMPADIG